MSRDGLISTPATSDLTSLLNYYRSQQANIVPRDMNTFTQRFDQTAQPQGIAQINNSKDLVQNKLVKSLVQNRLMDNIKNFKPPSLMLLSSMLPKEDPVITQSRDYFSGLYGLDDIGRIAQGDPNNPNLMAGYNPISGGLINTLTGGRLGDPTNVGLDRAYQKRIDTIRNTGIPRLLKAGKDPSNLQNRLNQLIAAQSKDNAAIQQIKLANATSQQKKTMNDYKSGKINSGMPEQPSVGGGGRDYAPMQTFAAPTKAGQSPRGSMSGQSISDRGMGKY